MHQAIISSSKRLDSRASYKGSLNSLSSSYSTMSVRSKVPLREDKDRSTTWKDIQLILPTALILLFTALVMVTVIPYAFSSVFRQMEAVRALEAAAAMANAVAGEDTAKAAESFVQQGSKNFTEDL
eukprot:GFUD01070363.1.p1 GENE.GFUD01070363.1~~GFUD01070363.1.p1  ORF type:complete len:137 (-),score=27.71 GFUD01070363.1:7-384(-)